MITTYQNERAVDTRVRPLVSWGSIFAGWLLGNAVMLLLFNLGSALGLSALDLNRPEAMAKGMAIGTAIWALLTWAVSFYIGGYSASWLSGNAERGIGIMHGLLVWAMAAATAFLLGVSGIAMAGRAGQAVGGSLITAGAAVEGGGIPMQSLETELKDQIASAAAQASGGAISAEEARTAEATQQAKGAAETASKVSAAALWIVFLSGVIGLAFASFGGASGAGRPGTVRRFERVEVS